MRRREFIALIGGVAATWPYAARAQQPKTAMIGILNFENPEPFRTMLRDGLRDLGYSEGGNLRLEFRSAEGDRDRLVGLAAELVGLKVDVLVAYPTPAVDAAFAGFAERKAEAVLACNDPFFGSYREKLAALALRHKLPAMSLRREFVEAGGLLSYGAVFEEVYRQAGIYAGRILKGAKTADLPVMQPTKFELVVNLKTAKTMGLTISESFLLRADEIIE